VIAGGNILSYDNCYMARFIDIVNSINIIFLNEKCIRKELIQMKEYIKKKNDHTYTK